MSRNRVNILILFSSIILICCGRENEDVPNPDISGIELIYNDSISLFPGSSTPYINMNGTNIQLNEDFFGFQLTYNNVSRRYWIDSIKASSNPKDLLNFNQSFHRLSIGCMDYDSLRFVKFYAQENLETIPIMDKGVKVYDLNGYPKYKDTILDSIKTKSGVLNLNSNAWLIEPDYAEIWLLEDGFTVCQMRKGEEYGFETQYKHVHGKTGKTIWSQNFAEGFIPDSSNIKYFVPDWDTKNEILIGPYYSNPTFLYNCEQYIVKMENRKYSELLLFFLHNYPTYEYENCDLILKTELGGGLIERNDSTFVEAPVRYDSLYYIGDSEWDSIRANIWYKGQSNADCSRDFVDFFIKKHEKAYRYTEPSTILRIDDKTGEYLLSETGEHQYFTGYFVTPVWYRGKEGYNLLIEGTKIFPAPGFTAYIPKSQLVGQNEISDGRFKFVDNEGNQIESLNTLQILEIIETDKNHYLCTSLNGDIYNLDPDGNLIE